MPLPSFSYRNTIAHLVFWAALFGLWYFFRYDDFANKQMLLQVTLIKTADLALMVYITNYILIPRLLYRKQYVVFGILFLCFVFLTSWLKMYLEGQLMHNPQVFDLSRYPKRRIYDNMIPHLLLVSTGAAFKLLIDYARAQRKLGELAKEKAETELNFLKSQINPHVVFNSLNAVYFLISKENTEARNALHKFSDMLRYQLYDCTADTISIEKELAYLDDYMALQKLRKDALCVVDVHRSGLLTGFSIAPLLLVPFVENAFKHLSRFPDKPNRITITIEHNDGCFRFTVTNTTEPGTHSTGVVRQGGIGLKNVRRRLELLYPGRHSWHTELKDGIFTAQLELRMA
jgi:sensor histidine kinase YesM